MSPQAPIPTSYTTWSLPDIKLLHHPASSPVVTPVVIISLDRPAQHNAFTYRMTESLIVAFDTISDDPRVKAVVLSGGTETGNRFFCAGMDLNMATSKDDKSSGIKIGDRAASEEEGKAKARETHRDGGGRVALSIYNCSKPVIVALNGSAVGVGITMTLPANIRIVSSKAKIGFVFARRGLCNEATSSFFLPKLIGSGRACHVLTTGSVYPSTSPLFSGMFSEIVEPDNVVERAVAVAEDIAKNTSAVSTRVMKDLVFREMDGPEEAHRLESMLFWDLFRGRDAEEGMRSFLEKRDARFEGSVAREEDRPVAWPWWKDDEGRKDVKSKI
ncbi:enoyl-CoA hydratase/isomerase [Zalerion maritima]|uniref:Enoyl-CoA hydratase/isomerase n=1 Tax=Zalerion maritima TaxID=339359 RepID=A0AAD5RZB0_9PEZI|nr:enoyl-CoA hydratase/isomerase [Zalerion maritima]